MTNDCSRCHKRPGLAWAIWPEVGKVWLCEPCGKVQKNVVRKEADRLFHERKLQEKQKAA